MPIAPELYDQPTPAPGTPAPNDSGLSISAYAISVSTTTIEVRVDRSKQTKDPTSYKVIYAKIADAENKPITPIVTSTLVFNVSDPKTDTVFTIANLDEGCTYSIQIRAEASGIYGNWESQVVVMNLTRFSGKVIGVSAYATNSLTSTKGFLTISGPKVKNKFAIATKTFSDLPAAPYVTEEKSSAANTKKQNFNKYTTPSYFSYGTSIFFKATIDQLNQSAGIGFFTNSEGKEGYFVLIDNTAYAASLKRKTIRIAKVQGDNIYILQDSQRTQDNTYEGIYGGIQYDIDIKVKVQDYSVTMIVYINGFQISATDTSSFSLMDNNKIVNPSKNVSLMCSQGEVAFDYVYAVSIDKEAYENSSYQSNFYRGQFSNDTLSSLYGDLVYFDDKGADVVPNATPVIKGGIEEFGVTAREITKVNTKFQSRPSLPIKWGVGNNRYAQILSSKISNFGAEAYVLNNSSVTVPLSDNNVTSLYILGNTLSPSGQLEYSTDEEQTYVTKEPVVFESKWLQNLNDVKSLANWIKANVVNKGKIVNMTIFGNPLLKVGDIVSINYPYHGFAGTEKFIIVNINHSYSQGLETSITCRLIAS